jgi:hypothetical protein
MQRKAEEKPLFYLIAMNIVINIEHLINSDSATYYDNKSNVIFLLKNLFDPSDLSNTLVLIIIFFHFS